MVAASLRYFFYILLYLTISSAYGDELTEIQKNINHTMSSMCKTLQFSGAILIAINNEVIYKNACGIANRSFEVPNNINTKFNIGSVGKLFTSVAIAQLIQEGKISLNTPAYKIIPDWLPNNGNLRAITIEELLIHTSGLKNFMDNKDWKLGADSGLYKIVNDYKPLIAREDLLFAPGKSQSYSNNGYILLGAIIETITKKNYSEYIEKNIFKPAGMINTGIWALDEVILNRAEGYFKTCVKDKCNWKNNNFAAPFIGSPAGGAYSTIDDLFQFAKYLHQSQLKKEILSGNIEFVSNDIKIKSYKIDNIEIPENFSSYGFAGAWNKYGFAVWEDPELVGHTGGADGVSAFFATSPNGKYTIIILSNVGGPGPITFYKNIREILKLPVKITNY